MHAAIGDLWSRAETDRITAYIDEGENQASRRVAAKLGFAVRGQGHGRSGEPMTVYELRRDAWQSEAEAKARDSTVGSARVIRRAADEVDRFAKP